MTLNEIKVTTQILRETPCDNLIGDQPERIADAWRECIPQAPWYDSLKEAFVVWNLNTRMKIIGYTLVSIGTLNSVEVHPREVFRPAITQGAHSIVISHNHPSGDTSPSEADIKVTRNLIRAGDTLNIKLQDHIIIGQPTAHHRGFTSLREMGYFYS